MLDTRLGRPWLLLASLPVLMFLTNCSTELCREHYLCSTTMAVMSWPSPSDSAAISRSLNF
jgi:hypothetical protein